MNELNNTLTGTLPSGFSVPTLKPYPGPGEPGGPSSYNKGVEKIQAISGQNIKTLKGAQRTEGQMSAFQRIMSLATRAAYEKRQKSELANVNKQIDPTKVSGGFFGSVIGKLNQRRGEQTEKIHNTNIGAYRDVQSEITRRLEYIQDLESKKREYMIDYKYATKGAKKKKKKEEKEQKGEFNRQYIEGLQRAGSDTAYMNFGPAQIQQSIRALAEQNYSREDIDQALISEQIPTFPGSVAHDTLNSLFA